MHISCKLVPYGVMSYGIDVGKLEVSNERYANINGVVMKEYRDVM